MAEFIIALPLIMRWESMTWTIDPNDLGGETYCGISRVSWGHLKIWEHIDYVKTQLKQVNTETMSGVLIKDQIVQNMVTQFYQDWWTRMSLSGIKEQGTANFIFQFAINAGEKKVARTVQRVCVTNGYDVDIDGQIGPQTINAINSIPKNVFILDMSVNQRYHYYICRFSDRSQNANRLGWEARVKDFLTRGAD